MNDAQQPGALRLCQGRREKEERRRHAYLNEKGVLKRYNHG
jgi:hypothetical protein